MAVTGGAAVANLYYNQPLLAIIAQSFHVSEHAIGLIPMLTQIGYAVGILLFVPLGDLLERRKLIVTMLLVSAVALANAALSLNFALLGLASLAIGMTTISAQLLIPFAAQLANPNERGKVVGMVMSGLFIGILLARTVSGVIGASLGWRAMYAIASIVMILLAMVLSRSLPKSRLSLQMNYVKLMASLPKLIREYSMLREAAVTGAMSFAAFSAFWSTLVFFLAKPPYHYGSEIAGAFGLVGIVGAVAAPIAGKLTDKRDPKLAVAFGLMISTSSFLLMWQFGHQLWGLIIGVILLDLGAQIVLISNQARIYRLPTEIHSRLNALFVCFFFTGGALGSFLGAYAWSRWGWNGVCAFALLVLAIAFSSFFKFRRQL